MIKVMKERMETQDQMLRRITEGKFDFRSHFVILRLSPLATEKSAIETASKGSGTDEAQKVMDGIR